MIFGAVLRAIILTQFHRESEANASDISRDTNNYYLQIIEAYAPPTGIKAIRGCITLSADMEHPAPAPDAESPISYS